MTNLIDQPTGKPARVERVKGCGECPFLYTVDADKVFYYCTNNEERLIADHTGFDEKGCPDWCPLRQGPVRVELEE